MSNENLPVAAVNLPAARIETVIAQRKAIMQAVKEAMTDGVHYGKIPGIEKPGCFKPGAEVLCLTFGLRPQFTEVVREFDGGGMESIFTCSLFSPDGQIMGQGIGSCSTMESKYRYRNANLKCPECGKETIRKSKYPPRDEPNGKPGWYCHEKAGGCGAGFKAGDPAIEKQERGKVENPDIADQRNTVRKMAKKRAHVDAALTTTGASEFFTQDVEDFPEYAVEIKAVQPELKPAPQPTNGTPRKPSANERIEAELSPDLYKLEAPKSAYGNKKMTLAEIHAKDRNWIPRVFSDPKRRAACTQRDIANLDAFWAVMKDAGAAVKESIESVSDAELDAADDAGMFDVRGA